VGSVLTGVREKNMKNREIKRIQRGVNHKVRAMNRNLMNDELWKGRFVISQTNRRVWAYSDGSGYDMRVELIIKDKQTGIYAKEWFDVYALTYGWRSWSWINDFIVYSVDVWKEKPKRETSIDWRDRQGCAPTIEHDVHHDALKYFR
jgi:hypothetical protein